MNESPNLLFSDSTGKIYTHPFLKMCVDDGSRPLVSEREELISLPRGSSFFYLPGRSPIGFNPNTNEFETLSEYKGKKVWAMSVFLPPAFLRLYNPAREKTEDIRLPLWAYSACGYKRGKVYVTAKRIDKRIRQSPGFYDNKEIEKRVAAFSQKYSNNRLYEHLSYCALNYNCLAAKNLFMQRWEAPLPTSQRCNSGCLGCLSLQPKADIASHQRIKFKPKVSEVVEVAVTHLRVARQAIVSFGQGCEGEPILETDLISASVSAVRKKVKRGTININTNASIPKNIERLSKAGVDSFRVSLNSLREEYYNRYFRPKGYSFKDVIKSVKIMKRYKKFVSINLFVYPGFTDSEKEVAALEKFLEKTNIDMIQWRNLNIDPDYYQRVMIDKNTKPLKVLRLIDTIKKKFPDLKTGYFNLPKEQF